MMLIATRNFLDRYLDAWNAPTIVSLPGTVGRFRSSLSDRPLHGRFQLGTIAGAAGATACRTGPPSGCPTCSISCVNTTGAT